MNDTGQKSAPGLGPWPLVLGVPALAGTTAFILVAAILAAPLGMERALRTGGVTGIAAAVGALLVDVPAVHWAMVTGRSRVSLWLALGAAAGVVPIATAFVGLAIGALARGQLQDLDLTFPLVMRMVLDVVGLAELRVRLSMTEIAMLPVFVGAITNALFWCGWQVIPGRGRSTSSASTATRR
jgi:hypothetical protein